MRGTYAEIPIPTTKEQSEKTAGCGTSDCSDSSSPTVVYIQGIGNKPAPSVLKRQWDQALFKVDMGSAPEWRIGRILRPDAPSRKFILLSIRRSDLLAI